MVVMPVGFEAINMRDKNARDKYWKCPICKYYVQPLTCAFSNCDWMWKGQVTGHKMCESGWRRVGNEYLRLPYSDETKLDYESLRIITMKHGDDRTLPVIFSDE